MNKYFSAATLLSALCVTPVQAQDKASLDSRIEFKLDGAYLGGLGDSKGSKMYNANVGFGVRQNNYVYYGLSVGVMNSTESGSDAIIPVATEFVFYAGHHKITPMLGIRLGYGYNTAESQTIKVPNKNVRGTHNETINPSNYFIGEIMPGIQLALGDRLDLNLQAGLSVVSPYNSDTGVKSTAWCLRAGIGFHGATRYKGMGRTPKPKKEPAPVRSKGAQLGMDVDYLTGSAMQGAGVNLYMGYQFTEHLSAGVGIGGTFGSLKDDDVKCSTYVGSTTSEAVLDGTFSGLNIFARGQWRFSDKAFSPLASLDLGVRGHYFLTSAMRHPVRTCAC